MRDLQSESTLDRHGDDWRRWVIENLQRGCAPHRMLEDMTHSTWDIEQAQRALDEALLLLGMQLDWKRRVPTIASGGEGGTAGPGFTVLCRIAKPRAVLLDGLLSAQECERLIEYAHEKGLKKSGVVDPSSGDSVVHGARTSTSVFFTRAETPLIDSVEQKLAQITGWPVTHGEGLQVLRYEPGQQYKPHFDWFDKSKPGAASHLSRGGQRVATTVVYLATAESGGGTFFPEAGVEVLPRAGGGIFFNNVDLLGKPDGTSLHSGTPVISGVKIVATYWQREGAFV
jgi:prolyl 4-hydroxylase